MSCEFCGFLILPIVVVFTPKLCNIIIDMHWKYLLKLHQTVITLITASHYFSIQPPHLMWQKVSVLCMKHIFLTLLPCSDHPLNDCLIQCLSLGKINCWTRIYPQKMAFKWICIWYKIFEMNLYFLYYKFLAYIFGLCESMHRVNIVLKIITGMM